MLNTEHFLRDFYSPTISFVKVSSNHDSGMYSQKDIFDFYINGIHFIILNKYKTVTPFITFTVLNIFKDLI